ncbi:DNA primase family protein [Fructilactobacillus frigidiflavus]|uniref:DNA primase family protein n=1 Tax=Fructilactobacillus frigidiflavus TaxID=3242688 RepID=UPI0037583CD5
MTNKLINLKDDQRGQEIIKKEQAAKVSQALELRNKKDFKTSAELYKCLEEDASLTREERADRINQRTAERMSKPVNELTESEKKDPSTIKLSSNDAVNILERHLYFGLFSEEESARVAFYDPIAGIYSYNFLQLRTIIRQVLPTMTDGGCNNVISLLTTNAYKRGIKSINTDKNLIAVNNGMYDLKQGKLLPFSHKYYIKSKIYTNYNKDAKAPNINGWNVEKWFDDLACGDKQIVNAFWQVIRDVVNANFTHRTAIFLKGNLQGNNGKGTFQSLLQNLVGKGNYSTLKLMQFAGEFSLSTAVDKALLIGDDNPKAIAIKDNSNFNSVVSGDSILVNPKGVAAYPYTFTCSVIQSFNELPYFVSTGGLSRRVLIIPFNATFTPDGTNKDNWKIKDDYIKRPEVLEYILKEALEIPGFTNFDIPDASRAAKDEYTAELDPTAEFINSFFTKDNFNVIPTKWAYAAYKKWREENGFDERNNLTQIRLNKRVAKQFSNLDIKSNRLTFDDVEMIKQIPQENEFNFGLDLPKEKKVYKCFTWVD